MAANREPGESPDQRLWDSPAEQHRFSFTGLADGPADLAERAEDYLRDAFLGTSAD